MTEEKKDAHKHKEHEHHIHKTHYEHHAKAASGNKNSKVLLWKAISAILGILLVIMLAFSLINKPASTESLSKEEASQKALNFINSNLLSEGQSAELKEVVEEGDLYKITLSIEGKEFDSYITKDAEMLFPSALDLTVEVEPAEKTKPQVADVPKTAKPEVELFVMSHCPYGTQMEKGILPVVETLGDKIDFKVKFVYYAMHGQTELNEELVQYCIQKEQEDKYLAYLSCFLKEGDTQACLSDVGIDTGMLETCIAATDAEYKVMEQYNDQSTWLSGRYPKFDVFLEDNQKYGVGGSPQLVVNGKGIGSARDPASLLSTICAAFEEAPEECNTELSSVTPSPGFGYEGSGATTAATCG